jgi:hypothetical protein
LSSRYRESRRCGGAEGCWIDRAGVYRERTEGPRHLLERRHRTARAGRRLTLGDVSTPPLALAKPNTGRKVRPAIPSSLFAPTRLTFMVPSSPRGTLSELLANADQAAGGVDDGPTRDSKRIQSRSPAAALHGRRTTASAAGEAPSAGSCGYTVHLVLKLWPRLSDNHLETITSNCCG